VQKITTKRLLRKAERQAYASSRNSWARKIMDASTTDTKLFHTFINKQRGGKSQNTKTLIMEHKIADNTDDILNMWKEHFETLSTVDLNQKFDYEKYHLCTIRNDIIEHFEKGKVKIEPVKDAEVEKAIKNLKIGKSPDIDGITAEHYKHASTELLPIIVHILNTIVEQLDIPQLLKSGILIPVLKKNKDRRNPSNYRGIAVTKILQSILKGRIDKKIEVIQNPLQRGFTEAVSSLLAAFITSEVVLNGLEDNENVLLVTLDAEKAFDKLNHEILFNKLYHYGIVGDMWILLRNIYRKMNIQVKWEGELSDKIYIQDIQHGAKLSTSLYKCYNNVILYSTSKSGLGSHFGNIGVASLTCADDIAILTNSDTELQGILGIVHHHTQRDLMKINTDK
jgi:hypothetical protein